MYNQKPLLGTLINWAHPLSKGLVGAWLLNENSGNKIFDLSGNGNHGNFGAGAAAPTWVAGRTGPALGFDGNDYVEIADFLYGPEFTVSFWFLNKDNSGNLFQYVFSHGAFNTFSSLNIYFIEDSNPTNPGHLYTHFRDSNDASPSADFLDAGVGFADGNWHLYTITVASGTGTKIYIDGVLKNSNASYGGDTFNPNTNIFLASREDLDSDRHFKDLIDEIRIYNRALSASKIWQLYVDPYCMFAQPMEAELFYTPPIGAIINQFQKANLGADLYDGVLIT